MMIAKFKKCLIGALFSLLFLSCLAVYKIVAGYKNPVVKSKIDILLEKNERFNNCTNCTDLIFDKITDSSEIVSIVSLSFNGALNLYNTSGEKICFNTSTNCSIYNIDYMLTNDSIKLCEKSKTLPETIENTIDLDTNKKFDDLIMKKADRIIIYYWSTFISSKKRISEDFEYLYNSIDTTRYKYHFIRINCDLQQEWGLKKNKKMNIKFVKIAQKEYDLKFGKIPWQ